MPQKRTLSRCKVGLYGQMGPIDQQEAGARHFAKHLGAIETMVIKPPIGPEFPGFQKIQDSFCDVGVVAAEGGILYESNQAIVIESRDCPILVLEHTATGHIGVCHAGREQLLCRECMCSMGVIQSLIPSLGRLDCKELQAYVTGGICGHHFVHLEEGPKYVGPFVERYGNHVLVDDCTYALDLLAVIRAILGRYGVKDDAIKHDGLCTYDTPWLGSKRAGKDGSNWTVVVKK